MREVQQRIRRVFRRRGGSRRDSRGGDEGRRGKAAEGIGEGAVLEGEEEGTVGVGGGGRRRRGSWWEWREHFVVDGAKFEVGNLVV